MWVWVLVLQNSLLKKRSSTHLEIRNTKSWDILHHIQGPFINSLSTCLYLFMLFPFSFRPWCTPACVSVHPVGVIVHGRNLLSLSSCLPSCAFPAPVPGDPQHPFALAPATLSWNCPLLCLLFYCEHWGSRSPAYCQTASRHPIN